MIKIIELNICLIKLQTSNLKDEIQMLQLINIYNSCSLSIIFTEESFIISHLNELIKDDCKQLIVEDFNLHHSHWEDRRCFTHHIVTDALLNIIINVRLKLLFELDTITRKISTFLYWKRSDDSDLSKHMIYQIDRQVIEHNHTIKTSSHSTQ